MSLTTFQSHLCNTRMTRILEEDEASSGIDGDHDQAISKFDSEGTTEEQKQAGVLTAEASNEVVGWQLWVLLIGVLLTAYVAGLDNNTTYSYQSYAATLFGKYNLYLAAISVPQQVIIAVGKFPIAKLSDVFGRAEGYVVSLAFFVVGQIIMAAANNFATTVAGTVIYAFGNTGVQIMQQIICADYVPTKLRGLSIGILSFPYIINFACAGFITSQLLSKSANSWRWGPGSFAIVMPVAMAPVILSLALSQRRAKKKGLAPEHPYRKMPFLRGLKEFCIDMDIGCLVLIAAGFILILLPLSLYAYADKGWAAGHIIAMFVVGGVCIVGIGFWEWLVAKRPLLRGRFFVNKDVIIPAFGVGFFDFFAFYLSFSPAYYWSIVAMDFSYASTDGRPSESLYYSNTQSVCLTVFGILAGIVMWWTKRYKWLMVAGSCIRLLGIGLMIRYRTEGSSTVQVVFPQVLQGMGGGMMGITLQVAAQVSVRHQFVAMVSAFVLLFTEIGGACGTAVLSTLQSKYLYPEMLKRLGALGVSVEEITTLYGSQITIPWPLGTPERSAYIAAYNHYIHVALIIAAGLSAVPILSACLLSDFKLGDTQNVVSDEMSPGHLGARNAELTSEKEEF